MNSNQQPPRRPPPTERPAVQPPSRRLPPQESEAPWAPVRPPASSREPLGVQSTPAVQPVRRQPPPPGSHPSQPAEEKGGSRLPFWLGFTSSFLVLTILSVVTLLFSAGFNRFDLANLQGDDGGWTPPEIVATPTPQQNVVSADTAISGGGLFAPETTLRNVTSSRVNVRQSPGHLGKTDGDIIAQIEPGESVTIVGPSTTADNLTWWQVRYTASNGRTIEGWVAQATASGVQILGQ